MLFSFLHLFVFVAKEFPSDKYHESDVLLDIQMPIVPLEERYPIPLINHFYVEVLDDDSSLQFLKDDQ